MICGGRPCKVRNEYGKCMIDTANFIDLDSEADNCGFIRVNSRYILLKYNTEKEYYNCGFCFMYDGNVCLKDNTKRFYGCYPCKDYKRGLKEVNMFKLILDCVNKDVV